MASSEQEEIRRVRFALDHNFPVPILERLREFIPQAEIRSVSEIDRALERTLDAPLVIDVRKRGFDVLVTNDYHMFRQPGVLIASRWSGLSIVAIEAFGHDPIRATGAFLLDLPALARRIRDSKVAMIFRVNHIDPAPKSVNDELSSWAAETGRTVEDLVEESKQYLRSLGVGLDSAPLQ